MGVLQELYSSMTGNIAKAILCVRKPGTTDITTDEASEQMDSLRQSIMDLQSSTSLLLNTSYQSVIADESILGSNFVAMEVQFNPNTIYITSQGRLGANLNYDAGNLGNASANQLVQMHSPSFNTLQCQLIFDAVNISDAFMTTDISGSIGNLVSAAASVVKKVTTDSSGYSVQPQVDGLMSLVTHHITRQVLFIWGNLFFRGELMAVDSNYTMFNKSGDPIRAVVNLTITQQKNTSSENEYWEDAFKKRFKSGSIVDAVENLGG